jgi:hypothetical protein
VPPSAVPHVKYSTRKLQHSARNGVTGDIHFIIKHGIRGVFKKRPNFFLNSAPTSTESALRLLSAPSVRFWQQTAICIHYVQAVKVFSSFAAQWPTVRTGYWKDGSSGNASDTTGFKYRLGHPLISVRLRLLSPRRQTTQQQPRYKQFFLSLPWVVYIDLCTLLLVVLCMLLLVFLCVLW